MTYKVYGLKLTKGQAYKLQQSVKKGCLVTIRLAHLRGEHKMLHTFWKVHKITKLLQQVNDGMNLESAAQLKENKTKEGCFLPMLERWKLTALVSSYLKSSRVIDSTSSEVNNLITCPAWS